MYCSSPSTFFFPWGFRLALLLLFSVEEKHIFLQITKFTVNNFIQVGTVHLNVCTNGKKKEAHGGQIGKVRKHQIMRNLICHAENFGFDPASSGQPSRILICEWWGTNSVYGKWVWYRTQWRQVGKFKHYRSWRSW